jgi:phosphoribosylformimino-5-aminoimidazole carboxamide ribotide isomerase
MARRNPVHGTFAILPAIDLRGGRVVRLVRGDFARETVYGDDPVEVAARFVEEGTSWLHVVDLDGARDPAARQLAAVAAIVAGVGERARVEVAGGLRTEAAVDEALRAGAARAVVGTSALRDPRFAARLVAAHGPDRIAVALDVRDGLAVGQGWRPGAPGVPVSEAVGALADAGVTTFEVTAIDRDGTLAGPDVDLLARVAGLGRGAVIASAGIASLADVRDVRDLGCAGVIVGRALYDGRLALLDALALERG